MKKKISIIQEADQPLQFQQKPIYFTKNIDKQKIIKQIQVIGHDVDSFIQKMNYQNKIYFQDAFGSKTTPLKQTGLYAYNKNRIYRKSQCFQPASTISIDSNFLSNTQDSKKHRSYNFVNDQPKKQSNFKQIKIQQAVNKNFDQQKMKNLQSKIFSQDKLQIQTNNQPLRDFFIKSGRKQVSCTPEVSIQNFISLKKNMRKTEPFQQNFDETQTVCNFNNRKKQNSSLNLKRRKLSNIPNKKPSKREVLINQIKKLQKDIEQLKQMQIKKEKQNSQKFDKNNAIFDAFKRDKEQPKLIPKYEPLNNRKLPSKFSILTQKSSDKPNSIIKSYDKRINLSKWTQDLQF